MARSHRAHLLAQRLTRACGDDGVAEAYQYAALIFLAFENNRNGDPSRREFEYPVSKVKFRAFGRALRRKSKRNAASFPARACDCGVHAYETTTSIEENAVAAMRRRHCLGKLNDSAVISAISRRPVVIFDCSARAARSHRHQRNNQRHRGRGGRDGRAIERRREKHGRRNAC